MAEAPLSTKILPKIREDLKVYRAGRNIWGVPVWVIEDPLRNQYFKIDQKAFEILVRFDQHKTLGDLYKTLQKETVDPWEEKVIADFIDQMASMDMLLRVDQGSADIFKQKKERAKEQETGFTKRLQKSFFITIPLVKPDSFLEKTKNAVKFLFEGWFLALLFFICGVDILLLIRDWHSFQTALAGLVSVNALPSLLVSIILIKILHELSHAYAAKLNGVRVGSMGVAFMFFYPVLYTEATGIWRLSNVKKRCLINGAGLLAEWALAVFSLLLWFSLDEGGLKQAVFFFATMSLVSSVFINSNPFMKFDGYYLLADYWGMDNMMQKGLISAKNHLRKMLWGWDSNERIDVPLKDQRLLVLYGYGVWIYRIFLYTGLAVLAGFIFDPPLSIWLGVAVLFLFLVRPIIKELIEWIRKISEQKTNHLVQRSLFYLIGVLFILFTPFFSSITIDAMAYPYKSWTGYAPFPSLLEKIAITENQEIETGDLLIALSEPDIQKQYQKAQKNLEVVFSQRNREAIDIFLSRRGEIKSREIDEAFQQVQKIESKIEGLTIKSPMDGRVIFKILDGYQGQWLEKDQPLVQIVDPSKKVIEGYARIDQFERLRLNEKAWFYPRLAHHRAIPVQIELVEETAGRSLPFLALSRNGGGKIDMDLQQENIARYPLYKIRGYIDQQSHHDNKWLYEQPGQLVMKGERQSLAEILYFMLGRFIRLGF